MAFDIKFDYRFDSTNFFTDERKAILEQAGDIWSSYIQDEFDFIPAGETLRFNINGEEQQVVLEEPIDDLIVFISSVELNSKQPTLGEGTFYADFIIGSDRQDRIQGDDFEPWLGTIEFNASYADDLYFDTTPETDDDIPFNKQDFLSLSIHEIGHILGIGVSEAFLSQVENGEFTGNQSTTLSGGQPIPLDDDISHIEDGYSLDPNADAVLDKSFTFGERNLPTNLDLAILADIGYDIIAYDDVSVYRFFQYEAGFHFYTADENEKNFVIEQSIDGALSYQYENVAYRGLASDRDSLTGEVIEGAMPVYRFFNTDTGAHLYTMNEAEKNYIDANLDNYSFDSIAYYGFETPSPEIETVPLYRMYNTISGSHLFTTDGNEFNTLKNSPEFSHFIPEGNEGITYYVMETL